MSNLPITLTLDDLSLSQISDLKSITLGFNLEFDNWNRLFTMGLVDSELGDDDEMHDVLTAKGWQLMVAVEAAKNV